MKTFKKIYIEITNHCNLACSFCLPSRRRREIMTVPAFEYILEKISGYTGHLSLHVLGEPLLHPELELLLARSHAHGLRVNLTTNGTKLSGKLAVRLIQPALRQVNISLHSFEKPDRKAALDSYLGNILDFSAAATAVSPVFINLRLWNLSQVAFSGEETTENLILRQLAEHFGPAASVPENTMTGRGIILAPQVFLSRENRFTWPHVPGPDLGQSGYCRGLHDHIAILVDGTVVPCCLDAEGDMSLGNIFQKALPDILSGPRAAAIKTGFARQKLIEPLCRRCTYRRRFRRDGNAGPAGGVPGGMPVIIKNAA